jgi:hypothetical protein
MDKQMNNATEDAIRSLPQLPQRQDALDDQLIDLVKAANKLGLYDAADLIKNLLSNNSSN